MEEIWKEIPGFKGYRISNLGNVESCRFGTKIGLVFKYWRPITLSFNGNETHYQIDLVDNEGVRRSYSLHRLLYEIFVGVIPDGMCVDHKDRNSTNNSLDNLRLATLSQNVVNQKIRSGRKYKGVHKVKSGKWVCQTTYKKKSVYLGRFDSEIEAALAYNEYAKKAFGDFAVLNELEN